jgi:Histidine phosphatase superfamily (branch 1)
MTDDHPYHPALDPRYQDMLEVIPKSESLKQTVERSRVYWDEVIAPALHSGKTVLIVGHENNLRSLLMRLEDIPAQDIIHLNLPRAVPLAYRLDENLKPRDRMDGKLDEATGFLRGEWLGGDKAVSDILSRDYKQVYDTTITHNLEVGESRDKWNTWMESIIGPPSPEAKAKSLESGKVKPVSRPPVAPGYSQPREHAA